MVMPDGVEKHNAILLTWQIVGSITAEFCGGKTVTATVTELGMDMDGHG
jgi:hypothetical protein